MHPLSRRIAAAAVFALFVTITASFLPEGEAAGPPPIGLLLLGAVVGFVVWPIVERAERQGASLRPSPLRLLGAAALGSLFTVAFTALVRLIPGGDVDLSELLATLLFFGGMFYLAWPKVELEIVRRHGR